MIQTDPPDLATNWSEENSETFIDYGRYFVPDREEQIAAIRDLMPPKDEPWKALELCCGEGLLAGALLEKYPLCTVVGLDGSPRMLEQAHQNLAGYGERFIPRLFSLAARDWRKNTGPYQAVVSSLAIHHLDGAQKQELFQDLYSLLDDQGVLVIADIIMPADATGIALADASYAEAVRQQAFQLDGNYAFFDIFQNLQWNIFRYPDEVDKPSGVYEQLRWLDQAGFKNVDVYWLKAGHAIYGGRKHG
ncbi:MAG: class I SAM-dependent methyltransferase [Anaerolineales bacterium]|nr:class I SAM-dependent methyltransferase [Anaerolineales bacterium]